MYMVSILIITATSINPIKIASRDLENFISKRYAVNVPVRAPVKGTGNATNANNPRY
jgi:hypothetical protein